MEYYFEEICTKKLICSCKNIQENQISGFSIYFPDRIVYSVKKERIVCEKCNCYHNIVIFGEQYQSDFINDPFFDQSNIEYYTKQINLIKNQIKDMTFSWERRNKEISLEKIIKDRYFLMQRNDFNLGSITIHQEFKVAV